MGLASGSLTVAVTSRVTTTGDGVTVTVTVLVVVTLFGSMNADDAIVTAAGSVAEIKLTLIKSNDVYVYCSVDVYG